MINAALLGLLWDIAVAIVVIIVYESWFA